MKTLTFENRTHWRTSDIERVVRLAMNKANCDMKEERLFTVIHPARPPKKRKKAKVGRKPRRRKSTGRPTDTSKAYVSMPSTRQGELAREITIYLPRRGSKDPHPVAMVALAANAAVAGKVGVDDDLLPFSDVYYIVNTLAYCFAYETNRDYEDSGEGFAQNCRDLRPFSGEITPPGWGPADKLFIAKYKDPFKDATFLKYVSDKETAIKRETTTIARLEKEIATAQKNLRAATKRRKAAVKAIATATERRKAKT